jgi:hypothetical protein
MVASDYVIASWPTIGDDRTGLIGEANHCVFQSAIFYGADSRTIDPSFISSSNAEAYAVG